MTGIYIHIPFCRQACHYCDFHFSTNLKRIPELVSALEKEIFSRASTNKHKQEISTIYFGGGTPSLIESALIAKLLHAIFDNFQVVRNSEITLEANPEDLTAGKLEELKEIGISRLSIGVQTFSSDSLNWMNRAHGREDIFDSYAAARTAGFDNISLDLMYAVSKSDIKMDLDEMLRLAPDHISLYGLTVEQQTVFGNRQKKGELETVSDDHAVALYLESVSMLTANDYEQYEVSNFSRNGLYSIHNSNYWSGKPYLGFGPGAHSFDGSHTRRINVSNNAKYIKYISTGEAYFEEETLSVIQRINEMILTALRTKKGVDMKWLKLQEDADKKRFTQKLIDKDLAVHENGYLKLTTTGFLQADSIALELIFEE